jgi:hypothetical protein
MGRRLTYTVIHCVPAQPVRAFLRWLSGRLRPSSAAVSSAESSRARFRPATFQHTNLVF